ncbi:MAG TPA: DUF167 domain-containing protein [Dehalococcoidia bacterium]|nr:DUF167 domain-containing protein [Dehalococcoidia bacterium]|tara:strand:- start:701 stop:970 length:270 start_codon:yes stop_codon:yes gene_type:complete
MNNFPVKVQPKASRDQVVGYRDGVLQLRVTAPPDKGRANAAVVALLADALGVAKSRVRIVRGQSSRDKVLTVESLTPEDVRGILETGVD